MFELKKNILKKYDRSIPDICFQNDSVLWDLVDLVGDDKNIYRYIGLLMLRLGFFPEDKLLFVYHNKDDNSFEFIINDDNSAVIIIDKDNNKIYLKDKNVMYGYSCEPFGYSEIGMRVLLSSYTLEKMDGKIFTQYFSRENIKFVISLDKYIFELEFKKTKDVILPLFNENGNYARYELDNELEIVEYMLSSNVFNKPICEIYKSLCGVYIDNVMKYLEVYLNRSVMLDTGELKCLDKISIKNGNLDTFVMTDHGKTVTIDCDGNWSYEKLSEEFLPINFSMSSNDGKIKCSFISKDEANIQEYLDENISKDINIAYDSVRNTKKRVRELFNKNCK